MYRFANRWTLFVVAIIVGAGSAGARASVLYNVQTYHATTYSGAGVLGSPSDTWNSYNSILTIPSGSALLQGPILTNVPLSDSSANPSGVTFLLSDAYTSGSSFNPPRGFPEQNSLPGAGGLGDVWYASGNQQVTGGSGPSSADLLGTFGGLSSLNGHTYDLVIYGTWANPGVTFSVTGGSLVTSGSFPFTSGYEEFTGTISGGQVHFDLNNTQLGDASSAVFMNGAQLLIGNLVPEPSTFVLSGLGAFGLCAVLRRRRERKSAFGSSIDTMESQ